MTKSLIPNIRQHDSSYFGRTLYEIHSVKILEHYGGNNDLLIPVFIPEFVQNCEILPCYRPLIWTMGDFVIHFPGDI